MDSVSESRSALRVPLRVLRLIDPVEDVDAPLTAVLFFAGRPRFLGVVVSSTGSGLPLRSARRLASSSNATCFSCFGNRNDRTLFSSIASTSRFRVKTQTSKLRDVNKTSRLVTLMIGCLLINLSLWPVVLIPARIRLDLDWPCVRPTVFVKTSQTCSCSLGVFTETLAMNSFQYSKKDAIDRKWNALL
mgnify:CR=1 FL=1